VCVPSAEDIVAPPDPGTTEQPASEDAGSGIAPCGSSRAAAFKDTPAFEAQKRYYARMPASVKQQHLQAVQKGFRVHKLEEEGVKVGSACTGTDIGVICLDMFLCMISTLLALPWPNAHSICSCVYHC